MSADELKAKGNAAFSAKNFPEAIDWFTQGINVDGNNHVLYSNRSASYAGLQVCSSFSCCEMSIGVCVCSVWTQVLMFPLLPCSNMTRR